METVGEETYEAPALSSLPADRLLILLGGVCAVAFSGLAFLIRVVENRPIGLLGFSGTLGDATFTMAISIVFGLFLLLAFGVMSSRPGEGAILGVAFSAVLLVFGATAGVIGGILGLIGAGTAVIRRFKLS